MRRLYKMIQVKKNRIISNMIVLTGCLSFATVFCLLFQHVTQTDTHVSLLYVLAVLMVSRFTEGYVYGVIAAFVAVICVNFIFTYPYFAVDFSYAGYPLTSVVMFTVATIVSALMTQIKKQEQIKREIEKEKMRANLLRAVSHDIRTPLTSIAGAAAGILDNHEVLPDQKKLELVENIREDAQWLVRIVENLLSITRMNAENARLETQEELVEDVVGGAIGKFLKRFPHIQIKAETPEEFLLVPMDAILIEQVILNIMENAVIHGRTTSEIKIIVKADGQYARFSIEDNGEGIDEKILPVIFEGVIGQQEHNSGDQKRNMGIGLSVCYSIVKAHKGIMTAENKPDSGAVMTFLLPLSKEEM